MAIRKIIFSLLISLILSGGIFALPNQVSAAGGEQSLSVQQVLKNFYHACGGNSLKNIAAEERSGILYRGIQGKVPFKIYSLTSGEWYFNQVFAYGDQVSYGFNGKRGWVQDTKKIADMPPGMMLDLKLLLDLNLPLNLKKYFKSMTIDTPKSGKSKDRLVIKGKTASGLTRELEFDPLSGFLVRAGDIYFEDYRKIGKVIRSHWIQFGGKMTSGLRLKMQIIKIKQNPEVNRQIFLRPGCPLSILEPIIYQPLIKKAAVTIQDIEQLTGTYQHDAVKTIKYIVKRQGKHLMIKGWGWPFSMEIMPVSRLKYEIRFLKFKFNFILDSQKNVTHLEITGPGVKVKVSKVKDT